eukprot:TRINITY_DN3235_c0_g1_i1.p1 TRINITY_DN3235_c0_g1~~TRINITY_DN3235_c0_g1_i1.p1  ORF type:complete len:571 (+),score=183.26 TRINITY_DN3235_c0_g1_i1:321-2033(+)
MKKTKGKTEKNSNLDSISSSTLLNTNVNNNQVNINNNNNIIIIKPRLQFALISSSIRPSAKKWKKWNEGTSSSSSSLMESSKLTSPKLNSKGNSTSSPFSSPPNSPSKNEIKKMNESSLPKSPSNNNSHGGINEGVFRLVDGIKMSIGRKDIAILEDRRISRKHLVVRLVDSLVLAQSIGTNLCFLQRKGQSAFMMLRSQKYHLYAGDTVSLLKDEYPITLETINTEESLASEVSDTGSELVSEEESILLTKPNYPLPKSKGPLSLYSSGDFSDGSGSFSEGPPPLPLTPKEVNKRISMTMDASNYHRYQILTRTVGKKPGLLMSQSYDSEDFLEDEIDCLGLETDDLDLSETEREMTEAELEDIRRLYRELKEQSEMESREVDLLKSRLAALTWEMSKFHSYVQLKKELVGSSSAPLRLTTLVSDLDNWELRSEAMPKSQSLHSNDSRDSLSGYLMRTSSVRVKGDHTIMDRTSSVGAGAITKEQHERVLREERSSEASSQQEALIFHIPIFPGVFLAVQNAGESSSSPSMRSPPSLERHGNKGIGKWGRQATIKEKQSPSKPKSSFIQ